MKQGERIDLKYYKSSFNTNRRTVVRAECTFIKDYGSYIQVWDKYKIRRSIMKADIKSLERVQDESI